MRTLEDLPPEVANEQLDWVVATEVPFLGDLAVWMKATGGPIDAADGSFHSLDLIGDWFFQFLDAGCPGVPRTARPSPYTSEDHVALDRELSEADEAVAIARYAAQALARYHRPVFLTVDPNARWAVFREKAPRGRTYMDHNEIGIEYTVKERMPDWPAPPYFALEDRGLSAGAQRYVRGERRWGEHGRLQHAARRSVPDATLIPPPTYVSILEPLLDLPDAGSTVRRGPLSRASWMTT